MPQTPIYGFDFETPQTKPGVTITGDSDGMHPILAEQVEAVLASFDARISSLETTGFRYLTTEYYTSDDTFTKSSYSGLRAVRVRMVSGGGGGGGAATTGSSEWSGGGGGGGSAYAESFILDASLPASIPVTVGQGGSGGTAAAGDDGTDSSFGSLVSADHGNGASFESGNTGLQGVASGTGGTSGSSTGDITITGGDGWNLHSEVIASTSAPNGGVPAGGFTGSQRASSTLAGADGFNAPGYGAGGSGGLNDNNESETRTGGDGSDGIVIVDVFV